MSDELISRTESSMVWVSLSPVVNFQYTAVLDIASTAGSELDPVTGVTCHAAGQYLKRIGKLFPSELEFRTLRDKFGLEVWSSPAHEWIGGSGFDEGTMIAVAPSTIDIEDPRAFEGVPQMMYAESATPRDVTFRSAVLTALGLGDTRSSGFHVRSKPSRYPASSY